MCLSFTNGLDFGGCGVAGDLCSRFSSALETVCTVSLSLQQNSWPTDSLYRLVIIQTMHKKPFEDKRRGT